MPFKEKYLEAVGEWVNPGDSVIVDPDGKIVAGPLSQEEGILYAEIDADQLTGPKWQLDTAGHYARPDIFHLTVDRRPKPFLSVIDEGVEYLEGDADDDEVVH
jgi:nitrilase